MIKLAYVIKNLVQKIYKKLWDLTIISILINQLNRGIIKYIITLNYCSEILYIKLLYQ